MTWVEFLLHERSEKIPHIDLLASGRVRSFITTDGIQRETTEENIEKLKADIVEIEQILAEHGITFDA